MSINIGTKAHTAASRLAGNEDFVDLVAGLGEVAQTFMLGALKSTSELRVDSTAYARGMLDIWEALESARTGTNQRMIKPPKLDASQLSAPGSNGGRAHA
jgi:hypothetical protein